MSPRATMRAYCQHCDATEVLAPEEIYSSEFNFWCPRCQSILILEDDGQNALPSVGVAEREAKTKEDDDPVAVPSGPFERDAPTKEDDDPPRGPMVESVGEPTPTSRLAPRVDPYAAFAAELDAGIGEPERALTPPRAFSTRDKKTERDFKTSTELPLPPTKADAEGPDRDRSNGRDHPDPTPRTNDVRAMADVARNLDDPKTTSSRRSARLAAPVDSGPVMARETVRVNRPNVQDEIAKRAIEKRLGGPIRPDLPPLPNWDGGDTSTVRELAKVLPADTHEMPVAEESRDAAFEAPPADDALENTPVVIPIAKTTGLGSRTYERSESPEVEAPKEAPAQKPVPSGAEDLDWYALLDEALPDEDPPLDLPKEDESRVVIRLPETMAVHSEADAEQVRQLQAKLEARGVSSPEETAHPIRKLDSKKVRDLTAEVTAEAEDAGHTQAKDDETRDGFHKEPKTDDYDTRDQPFGTEKTSTENPVRARPVDPDAPTTVTDKDRAAAIRAEATSPQPGSAKITRADTGRTASDRRRSTAAVSGVVVDQFNLSEMDPGLVCARDPSSPEADYFKQLYQQIFHRRNGNGNGNGSTPPPRVVLVTSARRGEGKTTVAANLALVAARMPGRGAALLVEADPRGGDLLRTFSLKMKVEGLLEALESAKDPAGFILQFKGFGMLDVLPLGRPGSDAAELISSDRIGEVLRGLADRYPNSVVIIDGSSVLHAPDPLALARHVDGVVLVVRADATPREQIERARDLIGPEKVLGVVLNQAG